MSIAGTETTSGINGIIEGPRQAYRGTVQLRQAWLANINEMRSQPTNPALTDLSQIHRDSAADHKQ